MNRTEPKPKPTTSVSAQQLRALAGRYQTRLEQERTRLAQELHDDLTQKLTVVSLELSLLDSTVGAESEPAKGRIREKVKELSQLVNGMIGSLRKIKGELRPKVLDEFGLVAALEWEAHEFEKKTSTRCTLQSEPEEIAVEPEMATELYRMFQEILANVQRHAGAKRVEISIRQTAGGVILAVVDDGRGIPDDVVENVNSLGLLELRERAAALGGRVSWQGIAGRGTTVTIEAPTWHKPLD